MHIRTTWGVGLCWLHPVLSVHYLSTGCSQNLMGMIGFWQAYMENEMQVWWLLTQSNLLCSHVSLPTVTNIHASFVILFSLTPTFLKSILVIPHFLFNLSDSCFKQTVIVNFLISNMSFGACLIWEQKHLCIIVTHAVYNHTVTLPAVVIQAMLLTTLRGGCADSPTTCFGIYDRD